MLPQIRAYEHLGGATGRRVFYRAPRYAVRDLFESPFPVALIDGKPHALADLSISGLAAIAQGGAEAPARGSAVSYAVQLGETVLQQGEAHVARIEKTDLGLTVGIRFVRNELDLAALAARFRLERLRATLRARFAEDRAEAPPAFRILCADILDRMRACRAVLEADAVLAAPQSRALVAESVAILWPELRRLGRALNGMIEGVLENPQELQALKQCAERLLTPEFLSSSLWARAYEKPLGYPGDFRLAQMLAEGEGSDPVAPVLGLLDALAREAFGWVASRSRLLADMLGREVAVQRPQEMLRVLSIGGGAADEVRALVSRGRSGRKLCVTLIEQDAEALDHVYGALSPMALASEGLFELQCRNASHTQLIEGGELHRSLPPQHIIVVPAILDYLRQRSAAQLVETLYELLAPGGALFAGCLRRHEESTRWASELICDWSMIHRSKDELVALAGGLPKGRLDIRLDKRGDVYVLVLRKPRQERAASN